MRLLGNKKRNVSDRIDPDFKRDMKEASLMRVLNKLARDIPMDRSLREMTSLLRKTDGYKISLEELKIKPKNKNE